MNGAEKGLIGAFSLCLSATGLGAWSAKDWAAMISAAASVGVLLVYWYYLRRRDQREQAQHDEHEGGV